MIVAIIAVLAALAAPGMMRAMAINRAQRGSGALARLGRRARAESLSYGRAYMMVYRPGINGTGRYELWRGLNDGCRTNPWATIATATGCDTLDPDCTDVFDTANYSDNSGSHRIRIATPVPAARLCFEPSGDMYVDTGTGNFTLAQTGVVVTLDRLDSGVGGGTTPVERRRVLFPPLAAPRVGG